MARFKHEIELPRFRRARALGRGWRWRCSLWIFSFSMLLFICFSFFVAKFYFHGSLQGQVGKEFFMRGSLNGEQRKSDVYSVDKVNKPSLVQGVGGSTSMNAQQNRSELENSRPPKRKSRKNYGPCEIDLTESVGELLEPENYMNFTKFSLEYVAKEGKLGEGDSFVPKFGGHQTLEEREASFHAIDQTIHCGFVKGPAGHPSSGFDLDEQDKDYMSACHVAVSSCIFGSSDFLRRPASKKKGKFLTIRDTLACGELSK